MLRQTKPPAQPSVLIPSRDPVPASQRTQRWLTRWPQRQRYATPAAAQGYDAGSPAGYSGSAQRPGDEPGEADQRLYRQQWDHAQLDPSTTCSTVCAGLSMLPLGACGSHRRQFAVSTFQGSVLGPKAVPDWGSTGTPWSDRDHQLVELLPWKRLAETTRTMPRSALSHCVTCLNTRLTSLVGQYSAHEFSSSPLSASQPTHARHLPVAARYC